MFLGVFPGEGSQWGIYGNHRWERFAAEYRNCIDKNARSWSARAEGHRNGPSQSTRLIDRCYSTVYLCPFSAIGVCSLPVSTISSQSRDQRKVPVLPDASHIASCFEVRPNAWCCSRPSDQQRLVRPLFWPRLTFVLHFADKAGVCCVWTGLAQVAVVAIIYRGLPELWAVLMLGLLAQTPASADRQVIRRS